MIDSKTYTIKWIEQVSKINRNADRILVEKVIQALTLLNELSKSGLDYIFKGGTSLMLMLDKPNRLSIDIDIIIPERTTDLNSLFDQIISDGVFNRFEEQERFVNSNIEKAHFKFFYNPVFRTHSAEEYILLDILFEQNPYHNLNEIPIQSSFLALNGAPLLVKVPTFEDILGDKLTAFAPNTTGVPYLKKNRGMGMEILKQLFDIGNLFEKIQNIAEVRKTFTNIAQTELAYRGKSDLTLEDVLDDIFQTSLCISLRGKGGKGDFQEIQNGVERIKQYIISESFIIDRVILAASKAAYLSALIKTKSETFEKLKDPAIAIGWMITNTDFNKLNKLKKVNLEAFFYWHKAMELEYG
jgi:predicted nucleotidyltransferase component of viral defense system